MNVLKNMSVDIARRRFMWKAGTALAAPVAVAVPPASGAAAVSHVAALEARLALVEDQNAIRDVARTFVRYVNGAPRAEAELAPLCVDTCAPRLRGVRSLTPDPNGADDTIEIAGDRHTATAQLCYSAQTERPIEPASPLVEMARAQGGGVHRQTERGVLEGSFVKVDGVWKIDRAAFRPL
ncbi:MAG TPA: hypothetical protein VFO94_13040 [Gammaproteobacteria bacterium]|nr:hypothetical protein [Gammaproteobacteria bacterium]